MWGERQRRAIFAKLRRTRSPAQREAHAQRLRLLKTGALAVGAGIVARRVGGQLAYRLAQSGMARKVGPHPLKIVRAAGRLHPDLKGTVRFTRAFNIDQGNAAAKPLTRPLRDFLRGFAPHGKLPKGWERRRINEVMLPLRVRERTRAGKIFAQGGDVSPAVLAHELGHLSARGRVFGTPKLYEELRASLHGSKIYRAAGGTRADYWREVGPAYATYIAGSPYTAMGIGGAVVVRRHGRKRKGKR